jgi:type I restriction enzyme, S subunit
MREDWIDCKFKDVATVIKGKLPRSKNEIGIGLPYLTANYLRSRKPDYWVENLEGAVTAEDGDCLILWDGAGAGDLFTAYSGVVSSTMALVTSQNSKILREYLTLSISSKAEYIKETCRGTTVPHVSPDAIAEMDLKIPPLPDQKRIVDLISSVDTYIEALSQQIKRAKKSRKALIERQIMELPDSSLYSLKDLTTKIGSGATPRGGEAVYIETGVNLIRSQNVHDLNFIMRGLVAIDDSAAKALENVTVEEGDVLMNITGASVTRCCLVDSAILPARVNQHVAIIRTDRARILPKYLVLILTSNGVKAFLNDIAGSGSTRQALTKTHLEDLEILVPNIPKQVEIIEKTDAFDLIISKSQIALERANSLRSGLLNDLLSGEHEIPSSYDKVMGAA